MTEIVIITPLGTIRQVHKQGGWWTSVISEKFLPIAMSSFGGMLIWTSDGWLGGCFVLFLFVCGGDCAFFVNLCVGGGGNLQILIHMHKHIYMHKHKS